MEAGPTEEVATEGVRLGEGAASKGRVVAGWVVMVEGEVAAREA